MPTLADLLSWMDNKRRVVGRNMSDLATDPSGYLSMTAANIPQTIAEQGAGMAPMGLGMIRPTVPNGLMEKLYTPSAIKSSLYNKSDTHVTMTPDDFLQLAMPIDRTHPDVLKNVNELRKVGPFNDVPYLELGIDGKGRAVVSTHEGRHRALALKANGIEEMPVVMGQRPMLRKEYPDMTREQWARWLEDIGQVFPESGSSNAVKYRPMSDLMNPRID